MNLPLLFVTVIGAMVSISMCKEEIKSAPSPLLMKTAYCACVCCDRDASRCYRHSSIEEDYQCQSDNCNEEFCVKWQRAKCSTSCYCAKCKSLLPSDNYRCMLYDDVAPGCECVDADKIDCKIEEIEPHPDVAEAMEHYNKLKENQHCLIPCYCTKCKDKIPSHLRSDCEKAGKPKEDCSCKNTSCPTDDQLERFSQMTQENADMSEVAKKMLAEAKSKQEADSLNEKLKPAIDAGAATPITADAMKSTKCKLQCLCDKCRYESSDMEENCNKLLPGREEGCPACPDDLTCPEKDDEATCRMYCFCNKCKKDRRMPAKLKTKCEDVLNKPSEICPCTEEVDCNVLGKLEDLHHVKDRMKDQAPKITSEDGKPRPGKIKPKQKIWDEL